MVGAGSAPPRTPGVLLDKVIARLVGLLPYPFLDFYP